MGEFQPLSSLLQLLAASSMILDIKKPIKVLLFLSYPLGCPANVSFLSRYILLARSERFVTKLHEELRECSEPAGKIGNYIRPPGCMAVVIETYVLFLDALVQTLI